MTTKRMTRKKNKPIKQKKKPAVERATDVLAREREKKRDRRAALSLDALLDLREREAQQKRIYRSNLTLKQVDAIRDYDRKRKRVERKPGYFVKNKEVPKVKTEIKTEEESSVTKRGAPKRAASNGTKKALKGPVAKMKNTTSSGIKKAKKTPAKKSSATARRSKGKSETRKVQFKLSKT